MKINELLNEAKSVRDFRHENIEKEFPYWGSKTSEHIDPKDGFHFTYSKGELILSSTANDTYSGIVAKNLWKQQLAHKGSGIPKEVSSKLKLPGERDLWNQLGGAVLLADKTITISKEDAAGKTRQRAMNDIKELQDALKNLKRYGVTAEFKLKGVPSPLNGKTVGEIMKLESHVRQVLKREGQVMYHGTSKKRWDDSISKEGLRPGKTGQAYVDLIKGYSEHNIYLAVNEKSAEFYGKRQAKKDDDTQYVVLKIKVPDAGKFIPDDAYAHGMKSGEEHDRIKSGVSELGSIAYKGVIRPQFIEVLSTKKA
jgi:hypothetical protein